MRNHLSFLSPHTPDCGKNKCSPRLLPAVHNHRARVGGVTGLDSPKESEERRRVFWDAVVGPGGELELPHFPLLAGPVLWSRNTGWNAGFLAQVVRRNNDMEEVTPQRASWFLPRPDILGEDTLFGDRHPELFVNDKCLFRKIRFLGEKHYIFQV